MAKLVVINDEMKDRTFELVDDKVTVGRLPDNKICLQDTAISSHHAELTHKGDDYILRDLNSTNGTRVNGQRIVETRLYHGDTISFAHLQLQYFSSAKSAPQPLPSPLKKTVDLTAGSTSHGKITVPVTYGSSSPFMRRKGGKSKVFLQVAFVVLGLISIVLLAFIIATILKLR